MPTAYIALGGNIPSHVGSPAETLSAAVAMLGEIGEVVAVSSIYWTDPVGFSDQPEFANASVELRTDLSALRLLYGLLEIERKLGRDRSHGIRNGPRTLDLDLLLWDGLVMESAELVLPHPRMAERMFVLCPLAEIAPGIIHLKSGLSVGQLLKDHRDSGKDCSDESKQQFPLRGSVRSA